MSRYNLLEEPWIVVYQKGTGQKEVSVLELFQNADKYECLAGEMETQNFAVLRFLLAILQTVFSRFDCYGKAYPYLELNEKLQQINPVDEDDQDEYRDALEETWSGLLEMGHFPDIVYRYLETWKDHFYLFDDKFPFYQVTENEMHELLPAGKNATLFAGRNLNRLISESGNKKALFSPVADGKECKEGGQKDHISAAELCRWLIMLQGYVGLSDKASIVSKNQKPSKGWLFDIGGLYLKGRNVFETLLLNYIPVHSHTEYLLAVEKPCWELSGIENIKRLAVGNVITSLAELYTNWSRAIFIAPNTDTSEPFSLEMVKLPAIDHQDQFLEPMTVWQFNADGDNKNHYTPRKHRSDQALWRSFGLIVLKPSTANPNQMRPEILNQFERLDRKHINRNISICAVSMQDDGNSTSWVPVDETTDELNINDLVIADDESNGWVIRINDAVEETKVIANIYRNLLVDITKLRAQDPKREGAAFIEKRTETLYQHLNAPFVSWIAAIRPMDSKEQQIRAWYQTLKAIVENEARSLVQGAGVRDLMGIEDAQNKKMDNIITAYLKFHSQIKKRIG